MALEISAVTLIAGIHCSEFVFLWHAVPTGEYLKILAYFELADHWTNIMFRIRLALITALFLLGAEHAINLTRAITVNEVAARYQTRQRTSNFFLRSKISSTRRS